MHAVKVDRLRQVTGDAYVVGGPLEPFGIECGNRNYRHVSQLIYFADLAGRSQAIQTRHADVHQNQVRPDRTRDANCFLAVGRGDHSITYLLQIQTQDRYVISSVVDYENYGAFSGDWITTQPSSVTVGALIICALFDAGEGAGCERILLFHERDYRTE